MDLAKALATLFRLLSFLFLFPVLYMRQSSKNALVYICGFWLLVERGMYLQGLFGEVFGIIFACLSCRFVLIYRMY